MKSYSLTVFALLIGAALTGVGIFAFSKNSVPSVPATLHHDFSATGVVGEVNSLPQGHCKVDIAVYNWLSLSSTFPPLETPQQGEWYEVVGAGEMCAALSVAMAGADGHVYFRIGQSEEDETWYFGERPAPALGCGGLKLDWTPPPRS